MKAKRFQRQYNLLRVFSTANPKLRKAIVKNADPDFIQALLDICVNILHGNVKQIPPKIFKKLYKHKACFRRLANCTKSGKQGIQKARKQLGNSKQSGGIFPFILGPLLPLIAKALIPVAAGAIGAAVSKGVGKAIDKA